MKISKLLLSAEKEKGLEFSPPPGVEQSPGVQLPIIIKCQNCGKKVRTKEDTIIHTPEFGWWCADCYN